MNKTRTASKDTHGARQLHLHAWTVTFWVLSLLPKERFSELLDSTAASIRFFKVRWSPSPNNLQFGNGKMAKMLQSIFDQRLIINKRTVPARFSILLRPLGRSREAARWPVGGWVTSINVPAVVFSEPPRDHRLQVARIAAITLHSFAAPFRSLHSERPVHPVKTALRSRGR